MREPVFVECRGCWRLVVLGISNAVRQEVITDKRTGNVKAIVDCPMPSHDRETCPDCGKTFEFPPLDAYESEEIIDVEPIRFRYGPPEWPERAEENFLCSHKNNYSERFSLW